MKLRNVAITVALVAGAAMAVSALTEATFILTNGQRVSGELVYHGGQNNNMIDNQLNLRLSGKEQSYPLDQVAVIDIVGGTPPQAELNQALSHDQAMALRSGYVQGGHFVNIRSGETLIWQNNAGQEQQYGLNAVARVYLNTQSAAQLFNVNPSSVTPSSVTPSQPVGTSGTNGAAVTRARKSGNAFVVPGNQAWVDTGIQVRAGDQVSFRVTGQVSIAQGVAPAGPQGRPGETSRTYPMPSLQAGALIGRISGGQAFAIGSQTSAIQMPSDGTLQLGINDDVLSDNTGAFTVTVQVNGR